MHTGAFFVWIFFIPLAFFFQIQVFREHWFYVNYLALSLISELFSSAWGQAMFFAPLSQDPKNIFSKQLVIKYVSYLCRCLLRRFLESPTTPIPSTACGNAVTNASTCGSPSATPSPLSCVVSATPPSGAVSLPRSPFGTSGTTPHSWGTSRSTLPCLESSTLSSCEPAASHAANHVEKYSRPSGNKQLSVMRVKIGFCVEKNGIIFYEIRLFFSLHAQ